MLFSFSLKNQHGKGQCNEVITKTVGASWSAAEYK